MPDDARRITITVPPNAAELIERATDGDPAEAARAWSIIAMEGLERRLDASEAGPAEAEARRVRAGLLAYLRTCDAYQALLEASDDVLDARALMHHAGSRMMASDGDPTVLPADVRDVIIAEVRAAHEALDRGPPRAH